ncbi:tetratricopeptide repeat protein [Helicobacter baculiformis]|uniref:tetratricopeptide repeat protein n=1 Tax=Helicobacter baculiformis TaxID=427351 RepID=UPI000CF06F92|nr:tetratricopeptide repeat protein [Helicobacter baculiformis]
MKKMIVAGLKDVLKVALLVTLCFIGVQMQAKENKAEQARQYLDVAIKAYTSKQYRKAVGYFQKAARMGNSQAYAYLAGMYSLGQGVRRDWEKAEEYEQMLLSVAYREYLNKFRITDQYLELAGKALSRADYQEAVKYYQKAAEKGSVRAYNSLGFMYKSGQGVQQNYQEAVKYYQKAGEMGDGGSYKALGDMYIEGHGVPKDYARASEYYRQAGKMGDGGSYKALGDMYAEGHGVPKDYTKAFEYYQKAGEMGDGGSYKALGDMYYDGQGMQQDYQEAMEYYQRAGRMGNADGYAYLGNMYYDGKGTQTDYAKAFEYYKKADGGGKGVAFYGLGTLYQGGLGVPKNPKLAEEYFQKACDAGFRKACDLQGLGLHENLQNKNFQSVEESSEIYAEPQFVEPQKKVKLGTNAEVSTQDKEQSIEKVNTDKEKSTDKDDGRTFEKQVDTLMTKVDSVSREVDSLSKKVDSITQKVEALSNKQGESENTGKQEQQHETVSQPTSKHSEPKSANENPNNKATQHELSRSITTEKASTLTEKSSQPESLNKLEQKHEIVIQPASSSENLTGEGVEFETIAERPNDNNKATQHELSRSITTEKASTLTEKSSQPDQRATVRLRPMSGNLQ